MPSAAGCSFADDRPVAVIVEQMVVRPPHQYGCHRRVDDIGNRRAQRRRPVLDRAQRRPAPILLPDQRAAFAAADRPARPQRRRFRGLPAQQLQRGPDHLAGIAVIAGGQAGIHESVQLRRQRNIAGNTVGDHASTNRHSRLCVNKCYIDFSPNQNLGG
jgi:hypothetical protein